MADPIGLLKDISQVIKKFNDVELMKQVIDLTQAVHDERQEKMRLSGELAAAKEQLTFKNKLKLKQFGQSHYYVLEGEDIPYCPVCYGKNQALIPLSAAIERVGGFGRVCPNCKNLFVEDSSRHASMSLRTQRM